MKDQRASIGQQTYLKLISYHCFHHIGLLKLHAYCSRRNILVHRLQYEGCPPLCQSHHLLHGQMQALDCKGDSHSLLMAFMSVSIVGPHTWLKLAFWSGLQQWLCKAAPAIWSKQQQCTPEARRG